jgi:hypothetical protein
MRQTSENWRCWPGERATLERRARLVESLSISRDLDDQVSISKSLAFAALLLAEQGQVETAIRLYGTVAAVLDRTGYVWPPSEEAYYGCSPDRLRERIDAVSFVAAWEAGRAITYHEALGEALAALGAATTR